MKRRWLAVLLALCMATSLAVPAGAVEGEQQKDPIVANESDTTSSGDGGTQQPAPNVATLSESVTTLTEGATDTVYTIGEGKAVAIKGGEAGSPIVFENCTFTMSGTTIAINSSGVGYNGETKTKLGIAGAVTFKNCVFTAEDGQCNFTASRDKEGNLTNSWSLSGNDACITFFDGSIVFEGGTVTGTSWKGQFLGLYGNADVTFKGTTVSTTGNTGGWSYAMYANSVLTLDGATMEATGMQRYTAYQEEVGKDVTGGNVNAFYAGDGGTGYDAINVRNGSDVRFFDNAGGGFAIKNVNIHVDSSEIYVCDNLGNACNSGYWYVEDSVFTMNGNRGGHALSCIGFQMTDSTVEIMHNGYAGVYIQSSDDSKFTNCTVDLRCNGEKLWSYTAGDLWLNGHSLTVTGGTSKAYDGAVWLGGVGRTGKVITGENTSVVAYDLNSNSADNLKSNTQPVLTGATLALNTDEDKHTLLLNPSMTTPYARGNADTTKNNNDVDLFEDEKIEGPEDVLKEGVAKIGTLTDAQLSHHVYDWENGTVKYQATTECYGAMAYPCTTCSEYVGHDTEHPQSFECAGTYVYAPLVGLAFDANLPQEEGVDFTESGMPANQTSIPYESAAEEPTTAPTLEDTSDAYDWVFVGWSTSKDELIAYDFDTELTDNWTTLYAQWERKDAQPITITPADLTIYMGGDDGYTAVVGDNNETTETNSLPTPLFKVTLPEWMEGTNVTDIALSGAEGRKWAFAYAGNTTSGTDGEALYYINSTGFEEQEPVRVTYSIGDTQYTNDTFNPSVINEMFEEYEIGIYSGGAGTVTATVDGQTYSVETGTGTLRVRAVDDTENGNNPVVGVTDSVTEALTPGTAAITAPEGTTYTLNDTTVPVESEGVGLLFDGIIDDATHNRTEALLQKVDAEMGPAGSYTERHYQAQYLDLVDANNGNAWVKASGEVTVYWAYPEGTGPWTDFTLYHFEGLHRDDNGGQSGFDIEDVANIAPETVTLTKEAAGLTFTVESGGFSPFVLVWETSTYNPPPVDPDPDPDEPDTPVDPDQPELNTEDHYAYIVGYPDGNVKPEGDITRAEVATIFFRLLTDESRDAFWCQTNPYSDVAADAWYNNAISTLTNAGIINGYEDGTFQPNGNITRAEFATMAVRFFETTYDGADLFPDIDGHWAQDYINQAADAGIVEGYPDGTFGPQKDITRAEAMTMVNRTIDRHPHKDHLLADMIVWPDNMDTEAWYYAQVQEATNSHEYTMTADAEKTPYEIWTELLPVRDWAQLEEEWSNAHSGESGGDVVR